MEPLVSLFRLKPQSSQPSRSVAVSRQHQAAEKADAEWCASGWSVHDSTNDLLKGVTVIEYPATSRRREIQLMSVKRPTVWSPKAADPDIQAIISSLETGNPVPL